MEFSEVEFLVSIFCGDHSHGECELANSRYDITYILVYLIIDSDRLRYICDHLDEIRGIQFLVCIGGALRAPLNFSYRCRSSACFLYEYPFLIFYRWIVENDLHQEPIELSLREGIGALMFERILCCEYDKRRWEIESLVAYGYFFLLHSFEEGRLYLRWSTVDLISEENMGEYGSFADCELAFLLSVYLIARQIRWQEIRRE